MNSFERSPDCNRDSITPSSPRTRRTSGEPPPATPSRASVSAATPDSAASWIARDTSDMRPRPTSNHLVGRVGELAELELAWREAVASRPALVLLGGESGVGKARLVGEFEQRLADQDALVLRGEGVQQGETELPYAPMLSALRPLARARHPVLATLGAGARAQLAALLRRSTTDGPAAMRSIPRPSRGCSRRCSCCSTCSAKSSRWRWSSRTCTGPIARRGRSSPCSPAACAGSACCCSPSGPTSSIAATRCARC